ncbi:MAG: chemotaxis protein CheW [Gammaproteobacteria bacterium]|nr:MAG: chemotaxis protein CheW [Pseudomonadota bacterium]PIE38486.1 MAG: chemotaxis protein CheW [Gammaproteobacteria bacterium]
MIEHEDDITVSAQQALEDYLADMFSASDAHDNPPDSPEPERHEELLPPVVEVQDVPPPEEETLVQVEEAKESGKADFFTPGPDFGRPVWAESDFQALLFSVAGLKMAVPLVSLGSIHPLVENLSHLVGCARWLIGLMPVNRHYIRVVDTALWVMPDRYRDENRNNYKYTIRLAESDWGLACDNVAQAITLAPEQVRWRSERSRRPWLAGTIIEHLCALVDADMLRYQLNQTQQPR